MTRKVKLVVVRVFNDYVVGQEITDQAKIDEIVGTELDANVVAVAVDVDDQNQLPLAPKE